MHESPLDCAARGRDGNPALLRLSDRFMLFDGIPLLLALIAAGLVGNHFNYPIFLNIDFLFGSIFAMLALQFFGLGRGIIAAAAIAGYTYIIWNHPYAIVIMTTEVAVVGFLMARRKMGMVLADTLYWMLVGMPLVYLFYHIVMHVPPSNTYIIMTKQTINGIANALIARMIFTGCLLRSRNAQGGHNEIIYNLLAFFVLCPSLVLLAVSSRTDFVETDKNIKVSLTITSIGIPEEDQERIYDAFYRSSNVDARRGLGLGLSIVKDALQTLNGSISLESSAGEGTTFLVELPVISTSVSEGPLPCTQS